MKTFQLFSVITVTSLLIAASHSCTHEPFEPTQQVDTVFIIDSGALMVPPRICDSISSTFSNDVSDIISNSCAVSGCHVPGTNRDNFLDSNSQVDYDSVMVTVNRGSFKNRVVVQKDMPKQLQGGPSPLTPAELDKIKCWLDAGAPNN